MNAQCAIFAESEVVGLIHAKTDKPDISKAIHDSMASRIVSMIRSIGVNEDVVLIGGVGHNPGFTAAMKRELKLEHRGMWTRKLMLDRGELLSSISQ